MNDATFLRLQKDPMTDPCDDTLSHEDLHEQIRLLKDHFTKPIEADKHPAREAAIRFGLQDQ
jgi:hypothetical protein